MRHSNCWLHQAHWNIAKGNVQHGREDPYTIGQSLQTWGLNKCYADCQQTKHGWCTGVILRQPCLVINGMAKPGHKEGADNSDNVKKVTQTLKRECGISQDVIKNNLDKMHAIGRPDE